MPPQEPAVPGDSIKVLYCSFAVLPEPSGQSARASEWVRALAECFEVDGLTVKTPELSHIERFLGVRLMRVPVGTGDLLLRAQAFERAVRRQLASDEYQAVHFTDPFAGYALCEARAQQGFKLLYEVAGLPSFELRHTHPHLANDARFMARLRRQELFCLMNADVVLVGSEVTARLLQTLGVPKERIAHLPTAASPAAPPLPPPDRCPMRVLYLGNQLPWQGLRTLLSAVALAGARCDLALTIAGPQHATFRVPLEEQIAQEKLGARVTLVEPVGEEELQRLLGSADVCVSPLEACERNEQQGAPVAKIAQYLAAGRPLVASDLPMVREVSGEAFTLYHRPGDAQALAACLVELAADPARRTTMGRQAAAFATERLGRERARLELLRIYRMRLGFSSAAPPGAEQGEPGVEPQDEPTHRRAPPDSTQSRHAADAPTVTVDLASLERTTDPAVRRPPSLQAEAAAASPPALPLTRLPRASELPGGPARGLPPVPPAARIAPPPSRPPAIPARPGKPPGPQEIDGEDIVELISPPLARPTPAPPGRRPPSSGTSPAEEWLGHVLFGYAPFDSPTR